MQYRMIWYWDAKRDSKYLLVHRSRVVRVLRVVRELRELRAGLGLVGTYC